MRLNTLLSATLASLVAGSAIPKDATLVNFSKVVYSHENHAYLSKVERQQGGPYYCTASETGPYYEQVKRGSGYLGTYGPSPLCLTKMNSCGRVGTFGSAGFVVCATGNEGDPAPCFQKEDIFHHFYQIGEHCPAETYTSFWSRIDGSYQLTKDQLPSGKQYIITLTGNVVFLSSFLH
jgi:hypothetical protein